MSDTVCPLTGLPRGKILDRALQSLIDQHVSDAWVIFVRVDRIEYINSYHGRETGDETIYRISRILGRTESSLLYRFDGPIFVLLFIGNTEHAIERAERLRKAIAESTELVEPVSVSLGLVSVDEVESGQEIAEFAMQRLRTARRRGGNTVCAVSYSEADPDQSSGIVLIVDPEANSLVVLIREIENRGFAVLLAHDGIEALQLASQIAPDVIISELSVPKLSGFELVRKLRQSEELGRVPFILLSHRRNDQLIQEAAGLRILHYFQKPTSAVQVAELVRNIALAHESWTVS